MSSAGQTVIYVAIAVAIVGVAWRAMVRTARSATPHRVEAVIYLALLGYALALPRFKNYSYMLLIVPTYYVATRSTRLSRAVPLLLLAGLPCTAGSQRLRTSH